MVSKISSNYSTAYTSNYCSRQLQQVQFKGDKVKTDKVELSRNERKELSTGSKVLVGTGIAIALSIVADYIFCKGKHVKNLLGKLKGNKSKPDAKPESKPEVKPEDKPEVKPEDKPEVKPENKPDAKPESKPEVNTDELKQQLDSELNDIAERIPNLSRSELAKLRYELSSWGGEISKLEKAAEEKGLSQAEQLKLTHLKDKLRLIKQREKEIEKELQAFHPRDTVSDTSAIAEHHEANGFNHQIRFAVDARANNMKGLAEDEVEVVLSTEKLMAKIDKDFEQLPPLSHDCIVYKGAAENPILKTNNKIFEVIDNAKVGDIVVPDTAYTYTAFERTIAEHWGGEGARMTDMASNPLSVMMCEIHLPKGAKVSRNMEHSGEILMPRGAEYKVLDKKIAPNGDIEVVLEYILPKT